jgi:hypothetical protein
MQWARSETLALAQQSCTLCYGLGIREGRSRASTPCPCVFRAIFRACYHRFQECSRKEKRVSHVSLEAIPGKRRQGVYSLKDEEYMADFCLVSKRSLSEDDYRIFKFHYLLGADWKLCCQRMGLERGQFYHQVYRIQERLGRVFKDLRPYSLFPVDEYFNGNRNVAAANVQTTPQPGQKGYQGKPVHIPVKRAA